MEPHASQDPASPATPTPQAPAAAAAFSRIEDALAEGGPEAAFEHLFALLREQRKYRELFEAILMRGRHRLGLPLIQVGAASDIPDHLVAQYEESIGEACREVGLLFLGDGDLAQAWPYLRAIGLTEEVRAALAKVEPGTRRKDIDEIIQIALHEGVLPSRGLEIVIHHYGICNSITNFEQLQPGLRRADREACVRLLVRTLHGEVLENLRSEAAHRESRAVEELPASVGELVATRPELFENDAYYVDTSHLWSILRFSTSLEDGPELDMAIELARYGSRLSDLYRYESTPPFEDYYHDHETYLRGLRAVAQHDERGREEAAAHFLEKARRALAGPPDAETGDTAGAVLGVLVALGEPGQAAALATEFEARAGRPGSLTPTPFELKQLAGDFDGLVELARERSDLVSYTAGKVLRRGVVER